MFNYTQIFNHKRKIQIPYLNLEIRGYFALVITIIISGFLGALVGSLGLEYGIFIFIISFIMVSTMLSNFNSEYQNYTLKIEVLKLRNKAIQKTTKHHNHTVYYGIKRRVKTVNIAEEINYLNYRRSRCTKY